MQDWIRERREGFKTVDLESQCSYRSIYFVYWFSSKFSYSVSIFFRYFFPQMFLKSITWCRYKIYVEGHAWSVSQKYILACDSMSLLITPHYYDFYSRGLLPTIHYWPINEKNKCKSIKFAVDWGNKHTKEVTFYAFLITPHYYDFHEVKSNSGSYYNCIPQYHLSQNITRARLLSLLYVCFVIRHKRLEKQGANLCKTN